MSLLDRAQDQFDRHKYGIIGTLMLHTLLLLFMLAGQVPNTRPPERTAPVLLEMESAELEPVPEARLPAEEALSPGEVTNVASNVTAEAEQLSSAARDRMAQRVEEQLMELEREEFERLAEERKAEGREIAVPELDPSKFNKERYMERAPKPVKVEGLTTVSHDLQGRSDVRLDVPAYLCKGSGRVAVRVAVNRDGHVARAEVDVAGSTTVDPCMVGNALSSASTARFNAAPHAPQPQRGTITYIFLPQ